MRKIITFDLSFHSTGISVFEFEENTNDILFIDFYNIIPINDFERKTKKQYKNVKFIPYIDSDMDVDSLMFDLSDKNTFKEINNNIKSLNLMDVIIHLIKNIFEKHVSQNDEIILAIENYIMPQFGGKFSLQNVSGLIALQSYLRQFMIMFCKKNNYSLKIYTPTPKTIKKFFTNSGSSDKGEMCKSFIENFNGELLLPDISEKGSVDDLNDIVDSFALGCLTYVKYLEQYNKTFKNN